MPPASLVVDPPSFFRNTRGKNWAPKTHTAPGSGGVINDSLPNVGVLNGLRITFVGSLDVTMGTGSLATANRWPYGLIDWFSLTLNGKSDLFSVSGDFLHARRAVEFPGYYAGDTADVIPGGVGAGNAISADSDVLLTWHVPIPANRQNMIASILAQAANTNLGYRIRQALTTDVLVITGDTTWTLTGTFTVEAETYSVPQAPDGGLIVPDVNRIHSINQYPAAFSSVGTVERELTPENGALLRLFFQVAKAAPNASATDHWLLGEDDADEIDAVRLSFGAGETPYSYDPAHTLVARNIEAYQTRLPYGWHCIDLAAENAERDAIHMMKVTDLTLSVDVNSGVTVAAGATLNVAQEVVT